MLTLHIQGSVAQKLEGLQIEGRMPESGGAYCKILHTASSAQCQKHNRDSIKYLNVYYDSRK